MSDPPPVRDSKGRIVTSRLRLRQWTAADRVPFVAMGRDPRVMAHFPSLLWPGESQAQIDSQTALIAATGLGFWAVETLADNRFVGFTGIKPVTIASPIHGEFEIGWRLQHNDWGKGYGAEAARAALHVAFVERALPSVVAMTVAANTRSWALMARLGMTRQPALDFDHPDLDPTHRLARHIVYTVDNPAADG